MAPPPLSIGCKKLTLACALPAVAIPITGALGTVAVGITELLGEEGALVPPILVALTVKLYDVPLLKPVTVIGLTEPEAVKLPGVEVTV
jgi:hypothetical protein